jgi:phosphoenolpyruvate-protein phosphotransferase (PTS system enzyme I)
VTSTLRGIAAAPGVALAPPWRLPTPGHTDGAVDMSLEQAASQAAAELEELERRLTTAGRAEQAEIFGAQALMAEDPELLGGAQMLVARGTRPADAVVQAGELVADSLASLDDELLAARAADVRDVSARVARILRGEAPPRLERRSIAVAPDLPPSVTVELDPALLAGIALEGGSRTAHAAILARALGIPAVVGVAGLMDASADAEQIAVDGGSGEIFVDPDEAAVSEVDRRIASDLERTTADAGLRDQTLQTADGHRVMLAANIGTPDEAQRALDAGAEGVGLFRTEFMFMGRATAPDEATQTAAYARVLEAFAERPVVIRLIDLGGDKDLPYMHLPPETNPFLGVRAMRLADAGHADLILTQLRAILAASEITGRQPWIMAPMVADLSDVYRLHELVAQAAFGRELRVAPKVGIMVEVPSVAVIADLVAPEVAFFSIGSNDLTQYLLAADRTNSTLASRQDPLHPAVLRTIAGVIEGGHAAGIPVAVCGEMAGDPAGAMALVGLGIDELSMDAAGFGAVKRAVSAASRAELEQAVHHAMHAESASDARAVFDQLRTRATNLASEPATVASS